MSPQEFEVFNSIQKLTREIQIQRIKLAQAVKHHRPLKESKEIQLRIKELERERLELSIQLSQLSPEGEHSHG